MESWLSRITDYLLAQSWQIAVLTVVVAIVSVFLRNRSAHVRYLIWLLVLAKCLVPPLHSVPLAVLPQEQPIAFVEGSQMAGRTFDASRIERDIVTEPAMSASVRTPMAPLPKTIEGPSTYNIRAWLAMGWLVGAVALLFYNLLNALRTQIWLLRKRKTLPVKFRHNVESFFSAHGVKHIPNVWLINGMNQPFVWGLVRGSIYLPADLLNFQDSKSWASLLGHELSHVVRFDAIVHTLQIFAQVVFWFHPFVWWANRKIRAEREKCCDEMTIVSLHALPEDYSEAIVDVLAVKYESIRPVPSLAVAGPVKNIEERIKTMLRPGKKFYKRPSLIAATFVLLLALLTVPTALVLTARAETKPNAEAKEKSPTMPGPVGYIYSNPDFYEHPRSPTTPGPVGWIYSSEPTALFRAIENRNTARVKAAVAQGADLEAKNRDGCTPLYAAVARPGGNRAMIKLLLEAGANPNARDPRGQIPLHVAVRHGIQCVEQLVSAGSNVNARDKKGTGPAMTAFELGETDMFDLMVAHGATVSTDLMFAYKGNLSRVQSLIENGKAQETFEQGLTLLHAAAAGGHTAIVELLLRNGLDVYSETQSGYTALHHAAAGNHREVAELLLAKGADVNAEENWNGWSYTTPSYLLPDFHPKPANQTPLHWAIREGHKDMIEWLLARGANPNADGGDYHPLGGPLNWAVWFGDVDIAVLLVSHGGDIHRKTHNYPGTPLYDAVWGGDRAMTEALVTKTGDTRAAKWAPLHATVVSGDIQAVEYLLDKGTDVNAKSEGGYGGLFALHVAALKGHKDIAELLITRGADVDAKAGQGGTPLHVAAREGHKALAELLISKGVDVNAKTRDGKTPMSLAKEKRHKEIIELLRKHGAKE